MVLSRPQDEKTLGISEACDNGSEIDVQTVHESAFARLNCKKTACALDFCL
jgi:hypothetical protein